ncbi:MAG: hypothetical protein NTZ05_21670 [Chloroflexi bacterium]|nr:hypothetical protein [Chloroflexota bacterium]
MGMSDLTYDVVTALQSSLEGLAALDVYIEDCEATGETITRKIFEQLREDENRHAEMLRKEVERLVREGKFR